MSRSGAAISSRPTPNRSRRSATAWRLPLGELRRRARGQLQLARRPGHLGNALVPPSGHREPERRLAPHRHLDRVARSKLWQLGGPRGTGYRGPPSRFTAPGAISHEHRRLSAGLADIVSQLVALPAADRDEAFESAVREHPGCASELRRLFDSMVEFASSTAVLRRAASQRPVAASATSRCSSRSRPAAWDRCSGRGKCPSDVTSP